ncbi:MAG: nuclear transport factor 2 family protein [Gammaproteobacteria bacterium]
MYSRNKLQKVAAAVAGLMFGGMAVGQTVSVHPQGDVFDTAPPAASAQGKPACQPAQQYVDITAQRRYQDLGSLFAEDAVFVAPNGKVLRGADEIGAFYAAFLPTIDPDNVPISFIADGSECVMELVSRIKHGDGKYRLAAIDHFTVNAAGKIVHMVVYLRPHSIAPQGEAR